MFLRAPETSGTWTHSNVVWLAAQPDLIGVQISDGMVCPLENKMAHQQSILGRASETSLPGHVAGPRKVGNFGMDLSNRRTDPVVFKGSVFHRELHQHVSLSARGIKCARQMSKCAISGACPVVDTFRDVLHDTKIFSASRGGIAENIFSGTQRRRCVGPLLQSRTQSLLRTFGVCLSPLSVRTDQKAKEFTPSGLPSELRIHEPPPSTSSRNCSFSRTCIDLKTQATYSRRIGPLCWTPMGMLQVDSSNPEVLFRENLDARLPVRGDDFGARRCCSRRRLAQGTEDQAQRETRFSDWRRRSITGSSDTEPGCEGTCRRMQMVGWQWNSNLVSDMWRFSWQNWCGQTTMSRVQQFHK